VTQSSAPPGDGWRPRADLKGLRARAALLAEVRRFFGEREVLEVETPVLSAAGATDPALISFSVTYSGPQAPSDGRFYLHTSPELPMKRLLAAGVGDIFQIARVFRNGEMGRWHNPEFTLLEWYRIGFDQWELMDEVEALVRGILPGPRRAFSRSSYSELFLQHLGIDPLTADKAELVRTAQRFGIGAVNGLNRGGWRDLLFTHVIEPKLRDAGGVFVFGFPAEQAALARIDPDDPRIALRFELYVDGVELANGFHELTDPVEQARRFSNDNEVRRAASLGEMPQDTRFLAALHAGMPDCSGVALGVDRLLMLVTGLPRIADVLAFPMDIA